MFDRGKVKYFDHFLSSPKGGRGLGILIFAILKVLQCIWQGPIAPWDQ
jgi:hypothetical protein